MPSVVLADQARADLDRLSDFLVESDPEGAIATGELILGAFRILARHPLIGRPADKWNRELVISRGRTGYVALYSYNEAKETVLVQSIRHQRESGFGE